MKAQIGELKRRGENRRLTMKATISEPDTIDGAMWEGEALSASWDSDRGEFLICGNASKDDFAAVVNSALGKHKIAIGIEDSEATQLVWRGYAASAKFNKIDPEHMECSLVVTLEDWFGILPRFSSFYFC